MKNINKKFINQGNQGGKTQRSHDKKIREVQETIHKKPKKTASFFGGYTGNFYAFPENVPPPPENLFPLTSDLFQALTPSMRSLSPPSLEYALVLLWVTISGVLPNKYYINKYDSVPRGNRKYTEEPEKRLIEIHLADTVNEEAVISYSTNVDLLSSVLPPILLTACTTIEPYVAVGLILSQLIFDAKAQPLQQVKVSLTGESTVVNNPNSNFFAKEENTIQQLIEKVTITVSPHVSKEQALFEQECVISTLKEIAKDDPETVEIVLKSKSFQIQCEFNLRGMAAAFYEQGTNILSINAIFPRVKEAAQFYHPEVVKKEFLRILRHEMCHARLLIIAADGDPIAYAKQFPSSWGNTVAQIENAVLSPLYGFEIDFDPNKKKWFILFKDYDEKQHNVWLDDPFVQSQLDKSRVEIDVTLADSLTRGKNYYEGVEALTKAEDFFRRGMNQMAPAFRIEKNASLFSQLLAFNNEAEGLLTSLTKKLSQEQKRLIYKKWEFPPETFVMPRNSAEQIAHAEETRKEFEARRRPGPKRQPTLATLPTQKFSSVVDFYTDGIGTLYLILLPERKPRQSYVDYKIAAFQVWLQHRIDMIYKGKEWVYRTPLMIAEETACLIAEMGPFAKELLPKLWARSHESFEDYKQSKQQDEQNTGIRPGY